MLIWLYAHIHIPQIILDPSCNVPCPCSQSSKIQVTSVPKCDHSPSPPNTTTQTSPYVLVEQELEDAVSPEAGPREGPGREQRLGENMSQNVYRKHVEVKCERGEERP